MKMLWKVMRMKCQIHSTGTDMVAGLCCLAVAVLSSISVAAEREGQPLDVPSLSHIEHQPSPAHAPLAFIRDGQPRFVIAYDRHAEANVPPQWRSIQPAVEALSDAVVRVTGRPVAVMDVNDLPDKGGDQLVILIGDNAKTRALGLDPSRMPVEGFEVRSFDRGLAIVGHDGSTNYDPALPHDDNIQAFRVCGTLWGVYDFIERVLGARFYYPGIGVVWPKVDNLTLPPLCYSDSPRFSVRTKWNLFLDFGRNAEYWPWPLDRYPPDFLAFGDRWRLANSNRFVQGHTPIHWARIHGKTAPDLFYTDPFGKRYLDTNFYNGNMFDVSRKQTAEQYIQDVERFYKTGWDEPWKNWSGPNDRYIPFGLPDNYVIVENERTAGLIDYDRGKHGTMSDVMARFYSWLSELASQRLPDRRLSVYAYATYRLPPRGTYPFADNIDLTYCHFFDMLAFRDPDVVAFEKDVVRQWSGVMKGHVHTYLYMAGINLNSEIPMYAQIVGLERYFREISPLTECQFLDQSGSWANHHLSLYTAYKLQWDPTINVDAIYKEYCEKLYGPAAGPMKQCFDIFIHEAWKNYHCTFDARKPIVSAGIDYKTLFGEIYTPAAIDAIKTHLDQAKSMVARGSVEERRIDFVADAWRKMFEMADQFARKRVVVVDLPRVASTSIRMDGQLDDAGWQVADPQKMPASRGQNTHDAEARLVWSDQAVMIAVRISRTPGTPLVTKVAVPDGPVYNDDSVEIFLSPDSDPTKYYQIVINSTGAVFDGQMIRREGNQVDALVRWNAANLQTKTRITDDGWTIEVSIPFAALGMDTPRLYTAWSGNVIVNRVSEKLPSQALSPVLSGNHHDGDYFAKLRFVSEGR